jgi:hypothetical protein
MVVGIVSVLFQVSFVHDFFGPTLAVTTGVIESRWNGDTTVISSQSSESDGCHQFAPGWNIWINLS